MCVFCRGLNRKRRGLLAILDTGIDRVVKEVAVLHRDRLARFAVELLERVFARYDTSLMVVCQGDAATDKVLAPPTRMELADDPIAVATFYMALQDGLRSAAYRRARWP